MSSGPQWWAVWQDWKGSGWGEQLPEAPHLISLGVRLLPGTRQDVCAPFTQCLIHHHRGQNTHTHTDTNTHAHKHTNAHGHTRTHARTWTHARTHTHTHMNTRTRTNAHAHTGTHMHTHTHAHEHTDPHMTMNMHAHEHTDTDEHTHTSTHTHEHTHVCTFLSSALKNNWGTAVYVFIPECLGLHQSHSCLASVLLGSTRG